jgi:hypothetical protein
VPTSPAASFCTIDPSFAALLLARNPQNRKLMPTAINRYAQDMIRNQWELNGATISIDS